jgi:hypothetical protein
MPRIRPSLAGALVAVAAIAAAPLAPHDMSASQQTPAAGTGIVAGQVIDATAKRPIAGAVVTLSIPATPAAGAPAPAPGAPPPPAQTRRAAAVANAEGRFVFRDVPAGTYTLTATRNGYSPGATGRRRPGGPTRTFTIADGARVTDAAVSMWRLATISGSVRDDRGEPVIGMFVTAMRAVMVAGRVILNFGGGGEATDDRGFYRIHNLEPGSYVLMVRTTPQTAAVSTLDKYWAAAASGTVTEMARELRAGGALDMPNEGIVTDGWQVSTRLDQQIILGLNGTVLMPPMTFSGNARSAQEATVVKLAPGEDRPGVDLLLPLVTAVRISGVLTGPDGPAANHGVQLIPASEGDPVYPFPVAYSVTDAAGRFMLLGAEPGSYVVRARRVPPIGPTFIPAPPAAGAPVGRMIVEPPSNATFPPLFAETAITVGAANVNGVSLTLQPGARLSGRMVFEGATQPAAAQIQRIAVTVQSLAGDESSGITGRTTVDASGAFQTPGHAPARYLVTATSPGPEWTLASVRIGGVDASDQAFTLGSTDVTDVVITFTDKTMTLAGSVRSADGGSDTDASVVVYPADFRTWLTTGMSPRRMATTTTSAAGAYQLRVGIAGDYLVVAVPPEIAPNIDLDFMARFASSAARVTIATGESKTLPLTVSRVR